MMEQLYLLSHIEGADGSFVDKHHISARFVADVELNWPNLSNITQGSSNALDNCFRKFVNKDKHTLQLHCLGSVLHIYVFPVHLIWLIEFCGRYQDLIEKYQRSVNVMVNDLFPG